MELVYVQTLLAENRLLSLLSRDFSLILGSRKPEAKAFKKWVTSEVLPAIRRRGYNDALEAEREKTTKQLRAIIAPTEQRRAGLPAG